VGRANLLEALIVDHKNLHEYDEIDRLLAWSEIGAHLSSVYSSNEGCRILSSNHDVWGDVATGMAQY
jgi:hypothetical protein